MLIVLKVEEFNGFKMRITYRVIGKDNGDLKATGETSHFFTDMDLKPLRTKKTHHDIYKAFADYIGVDFLEEDTKNE